MSGAEMLDGVKRGLMLTGEYHDTAIELYIAEVIEFLRDAGVPQDVIDSSASLGVITRGVADLWNLGSGGAQLSPYFFQRATQLASGATGGD